MLIIKVPGKKSQFFDPATYFQVALFLQSVVHRLSGSAPRLFTPKSGLRAW